MAKWKSSSFCNDISLYNKFRARMCRDAVNCRDYEQVRFNFTTCFFSWLCRSVKLLFANRQEVDILWKQQLDVLADIANPRWEFFLSLLNKWAQRVHSPVLAAFICLFLFALNQREAVRSNLIKSFHLFPDFKYSTRWHNPPLSGKATKGVFPWRCC